jgi:hypothetical protein
MGLEGQNSPRHPLFVRVFARLVDHFAVTPVNAVKVTDGDSATAVIFRQVIVMSVNAHAARKLSAQPLWVKYKLAIIQGISLSEISKPACRILSSRPIVVNLFIILNIYHSWRDSWARPLALDFLH